MKPLLAMPLVGTGRAGGVLLTGLIADMLVDLIPRLAHQYAVDILLCISTEDEYKLVQERRKARAEEMCWGGLTDSNKVSACLSVHQLHKLKYQTDLALLFYFDNQSCRLLFISLFSP